MLWGHSGVLGGGVTDPLRISVPSGPQIVAAIYETVLRPELVDRFCVAQQVAPLGKVAPLPVASESVLQASEVASHFSRSLEILEQKWRQLGCPDPLVALADPIQNDWAEAGPTGARGWLLLDLERRPLRCCQSFLAGVPTAGMSTPEGSAVGAKLATGEGGPLSALELTEAASGALREFTRHILGPEFSWQDFRVLETFLPDKILLCRPVWVGPSAQADSQAAALVDVQSRVETSRQPAAGAVALMIEVLDAAWPVGSADCIAGTFGLGPQEVDLLQQCLTGQAQETDLSQALSLSAAKVGIPGAVELIRLAGFLLREAAQDLAISQGLQLPPSFLVIGDAGEDTQCFRLGAETGQPVIFVHGMIDGIAGVQRLQGQLRTSGFRVYAPMRGGYGASRPVPGTNQQLNAYVAQIEALIDQENLQRPILLGHRSGAIFARAIALQLRGRIGGVVGVAPELPLKQTRNYKNLRGHQKGLAICASYLPVLVPLVLKSWSRSVRRRGAATLVRRQAQPGSRALAEINAMELDPVLGLSHALLMQQAGAGFLADLALSKLGDWLQTAQNMAPTIYLCGQEETSLPQEGLYPALKGEEKIQTRICAEAGNVLFYVRPELVLAALEELATEPPPATGVL